MLLRSKASVKSGNKCVIIAHLDERRIIEQGVGRVSQHDSPDDPVREGRAIERRVPARAVAFRLGRWRRERQGASR